MDLVQHIQKIVNGILQEDLDLNDLFLVLVKVKETNHSKKIIVLIDGIQGITIDQCGKISKKLGSVLEKTDLIKDQYVLEVSSPGLDHPIVMPQQYLKNVGKQVVIETNNGQHIKGKLLEVLEKHVTIEENQKPRILNFGDINQTKIKLSFK